MARQVLEYYDIIMVKLDFPTALSEDKKVLDQLKHPTTPPPRGGQAALYVSLQFFDNVRKDGLSSYSYIASSPYHDDVKTTPISSAITFKRG